MLQVLTVPMRNGNCKRCPAFGNSQVVLTVPMRNGNAVGSGAGSVIWTVLTVPMRNGNAMYFSMLVQNGISSYRTYEEWKHDEPTLYVIDADAFLPYL